jgi:hypothetical protein
MPAAFTLAQLVTGLVPVTPETSTPRTTGAVTVAADAVLGTDAAREGAAAPSGSVRPAITASAAVMRVILGTLLTQADQRFSRSPE